MASGAARYRETHAVRPYGHGHGRGNELVPVVPRVLRTAVGHGFREPISTLDQAVWRLVQILLEEGDVATDAVRHSVDIVACVFWMDPSAVWAAMNKKRKELR